MGASGYTSWYRAGNLCCLYGRPIAVVVGIDGSDGLRSAKGDTLHRSSSMFDSDIAVSWTMLSMGCVEGPANGVLMFICPYKPWNLCPCWCCSAFAFFALATLWLRDRHDLVYLRYLRQCFLCSCMPVSDDASWEQPGQQGTIVYGWKCEGWKCKYVESGHTPSALLPSS